MRSASNNKLNRQFQSTGFSFKGIKYKQTNQNSAHNRLNKSIDDTSRQRKSHSLNNLNSYGKTVSAFNVDSNELLASNEHTHQILNLVGNKLDCINIQYTNLYQKISTNCCGIQAKNDRQNEKRGKQQRYRLRCQSIVKKNELLLQEMAELRTFKQNWEKLIEFVDKLEKEEQLIIKQPIDLLLYYQHLSQKLEKTEEQHEKLYNQTVENLSKAEVLDQDQHAQYKLQKMYKRLQRKLNKQMAGQQQYQQGCLFYEQQLDEYQNKITYAEKTNDELQMKLIHQKGRKQRKLRSQQKKKRKLAKQQDQGCV